MKVNENVIYRCVAEEHMLIPVGAAAMQSNGLIVLNDVGALVWKLFSAGKTMDEVVAAIMDEYDASEETIRRDVEELTDKLVEKGLAYAE